ncbi:hypothetical protein V6B08_16270 [Ferrovibrio sp. MS7]|uniref:hypothetical protein n=1 Tax=Ferrovibrio plantarum TaxID=3119164 RepID=UPI0031366006
MLLRLLPFLALLVSASGAVAQETAHGILNNLRQDMYVAGETNGNFSIPIAKARERMTALVQRGGDAAGLTARNNNGMTPLIAAAFMGYAEMAEILLQDTAVRAAIDETDNDQRSAWTYSIFTFRQSLWACSLRVFDNPFTWVPAMVTQPYYLGGDEMPYVKTRKLLEVAGARTDMAAARQQWLALCKDHAPETAKAIEATGDLQTALITEGQRILLERMQAQKQQKQ